ncbi:MAG: UbiA family prenyltransferase [Cyclobacteriaceae bacterium]
MLKAIKSAFLHLRLPFSWFLLPFFLAPLCISPNFDDKRLGLVFLILHFLIYPASNSFNSYFDKDQKSIGGLKVPPPVTKLSYYISLILDVLALVLALRISIWFELFVAGYILASRAYSHPSTRIKKYPVLGLFYTSFFQGYFTVCAVYLGLNGYEPWNLLSAKVQWLGLLCSLLLLGIYPLTQVYQHEEDGSRGDFTFSRMLGIKKTLWFSMIVFFLSEIGFVFYFENFLFVPLRDIFLISLNPATLFFLFWLIKVYQDEKYVRYSYVMWILFLASSGMNYYLFRAFLVNTNVLQVF